MKQITVSLAGDGPAREMDGNATFAEALAALLSKKQMQRTIAVFCEGQLCDLAQTLAATGGGVLAPVTVDSPEALAILRHSTAHIMAEAVRDLFPGVRVAIGPAIADGFYYDFDCSTSFSPDDFPRIEERMREIAAGRQPIVRHQVSKKEAMDLFRSKDEIYKLELLEDIDEDTVTLYGQGDFVDLCRGPHLPDASFIQAFSLLKVAGAYWRGDEKRPMLQRLYGTAYFDKKELAAHLKCLEEAKKRDHRRLGRELELFSIQDDIGPGLILWQPKGALMRRIIEDFWKEEHYCHGYELLYSPHIARQELWRTSGHLDFYRENMYSPMEIDDVSYQLKPMNCPFHISIYKTRKRSYREFPIRWCELGTVYRYERTGVLHGLMRVRGFTQDDAHIFCLAGQLEEEIISILDLTIHVLQTFGFSSYDIYLSTRPAKFVGSEEHWEKATAALRQALERKGLAYEVDPGEGVFYGPKIDIKIRDVLGRSWQCSTIQVDFNLPERFDLAYTGADGMEHQPIMVHRALMGSLERFFGVLIEHYGGAFPLWLAPVQARILNVTDLQIDYCRELYATLRRAGVRVEQDLRGEKLGYKIREAQMAKIPFMLVVGDREVETKTVTVRQRNGENLAAMDAGSFIDMVRKGTDDRGL